MTKKNLAKKLLTGVVLTSTAIATPFIFNNFNSQEKKAKTYEIITIHGVDYLGVEDEHDFELLEMKKPIIQTNGETQKYEFEGLRFRKPAQFNMIEIHGVNYLEKEGNLTPLILYNSLKTTSQ